MKPKTIDKTLTLNKKTIANLNNEAMERLKAGLVPGEFEGTKTCDGECTNFDSRCPIETCTCEPVFNVD